jgi:hypothetical protein
MGDERVYVAGEGESSCNGVCIAGMGMDTPRSFTSFASLWDSGLRGDAHDWAEGGGESWESQAAFPVACDIV